MGEDVEHLGQQLVTQRTGEPGVAAALAQGLRQTQQGRGEALLVQHRVSGQVAVAEKPDVLWERPDLERLYARLEDEYELKERAEALNRKLAVISETAQALTDVIDTERSLRLEIIIVVLILLEIVIAAYQIFVGR